MLEHSQALSTWVSSTLLSEKELSERQNILATLILVAHELFSIANFHGCGIILEALEHPSIFRLKNTWDGVDLKMYNNMKTHYEDNYRKLRQAMDQIVPPSPCIPYLGMLLTDLSEIETGTPKYVRGRLVNFYKLDFQAQVILRAQMFQASKYAFRRVDPICDYLFDPRRSTPDVNTESRGLEQSISLLI
jgi:son of sevenless